MISLMFGRVIGIAIGFELQTSYTWGTLLTAQRPELLKVQFTSKLLTSWYCRKILDYA